MTRGMRGGMGSLIRQVQRGYKGRRRADLDHTVSWTSASDPGMLTSMSWLRSFMALLLLLAAGSAFAVDLEPVASGLSSPLYLTHARDGSGRLFVVEQEEPSGCSRRG